MRNTSASQLLPFLPGLATAKARIRRLVGVDAEWRCSAWISAMRNADGKGPTHPRVGKTPGDPGPKGKASRIFSADRGLIEEVEPCCQGSAP